MKNILFAFLGLIAIALTFTASRNADEAAAEFQTTNVIYSNSWADTITDATNDTLLIPTSLVSLWSYNHVITAVNVSGTTSIIAVLQENNARTGTVWYEVERDTLAAAGTKRLHGGAINALGYVKGVRQRLILDGAGTQVSTYSVTTTLKKE
jgi:hypothetical protein